jgi:hypothetical protein
MYQFAQELDALLSHTSDFGGVAYFREIPNN